MNAVERFEALESALTTRDSVTSGKLFGKRCLKVGGKAFMAQHLETLVFKLRAPEHGDAMASAGAALWDPSGKGRPMKEWVAIPAKTPAEFARFADAALAYVGG